jgi:hypothetical protein
VAVGETEGSTLGETEGSTLGETDGSTLGETEGSTLGSTLGETDGSALGSTEGLGDEFAFSGSQTANKGLTCEFTSTFETAGFEKVGTVDPPVIIAAVPVGDTKMIFEFEAFAVTIVHGVLQNTTSGTSSTGASHGPEDTFPRRSKRIVTGKFVSSPTIRTSLRSEKSTTRDSVAVSIVPF